MYNVILNVIKSKNYELADMLTKINTLWIQGVKNGGISDEEKEELIALARENAEVHQSIDVMSKLVEFDKRLKAAEDEIRKLKGEAPEGGENESGEVTYPEYVQGKIYYNGDKITFVDGKNYTCIAPEGVVCVWNPTEYPAYWEEYTEDAPLTE